MLVDTAASRTTAPVAPPPPPPVERPSLARTTEQSTVQTLQQRAEAGQTLTPVEQGTLARLQGTTALTGGGVAARYAVPEGGGSAPPPGEHLTDDQVKAESERILDVGDKSWRTDDYDARLQAFAETMGGLDDDSRQRLLQQVMSDDRGALHSWLEGDRLLSLRDRGDVSYGDTTAVVDAFSDAYRAGNAGTSWDAITFLSGGTSMVGLGPTVPEEIENLQTLLDAASYDKGNALRETLGRELLTGYTAPDQGFPPNQKSVAAALQIMGGGYDSAMAGRVYGEFDADQRAAIYTAAAEFYPGAPAPFTDPLATLVGSVASASRTGSTAAGGDSWGDIATDLVRSANTTQSFGNDGVLFESSTEVVPTRAEAYSQLLDAQGGAILDRMTDPRNQIVDPTGGDPSTTLVVADGRALANLMRATVLAPDNPAHQLANDAISDYVAQQHAALGDGTRATPAGQIAIDRLARIGAAAQFAGEQLNDDLLADKAAKEQLIGFCADIALAAVPLGSKISGAATSALEQTFGSGVVAKAAQNATGALIDQATGKLTEEGMAALLEAMSDEGKSVVNNIEAANLVKSAIFAGVDRNNIYWTDLNQNMQDDVTALR